MQELKSLSKEVLLLALTEFYEKYRKLIELGGNEDEFINCKFRLEVILNELTSRRGETKPISEPEREDFDFKRIDSKAD